MGKGALSISILDKKFYLFFIFLLPNMLFSKVEIFEKLQNLHPKKGKILKEEIIQPNIECLTLSNGVVVYLKQVKDTFGDEIYVEAFARGGRNAFLEEEQTSVRLASILAFSSGIKGYSSKEVSFFLNHHLIDFAVSIDRCERKIKASFLKEEEKLFFAFLNTFLKDRTFLKSAEEEMLMLAKERVMRKNRDLSKDYERSFLAINSNNHPLVLPLKENEMEFFDFEKAKKAFNNSFQNPKDFTFVIAGPFDQKNIKEAICLYLASLKTGKTNFPQVEAPKTTFPTGKSITTIFKKQEDELLYRLSYPMKGQILGKNLYQIDFLSQVIETFLREDLLQEYQSSFGVDVAYQFPFFPFLNNGWLFIQFRVSENQAKEIEKHIIEKMDLKQAFTSKTIEKTKELKNRMDDFWFEQGSYWSSMIANYLRWNTPVKEIFQESKKIQSIDKAFLINLLEKHIPLDNYTLIKESN